MVTHMFVGCIVPLHSFWNTDSDKNWIILGPRVIIVFRMWALLFRFLPWLPAVTGSFVCPAFHTSQRWPKLFVGLFATQCYELISENCLFRRTSLWRSIFWGQQLRFPNISFHVSCLSTEVSRGLQFPVPLELKCWLRLCVCWQMSCHSLARFKGEELAVLT